MIIATIRQELLGIFNICIPILCAAYFFPASVLNVWGILFWACAVGAYLFYKNFQSTTSGKNSLLFAPTGAQRELLFHEAERCGVRADGVDFRYAYCDDAIGLTMFDTIVLDPMVWKGIDDPEFEKARNVVIQQVIPAIPENKKQFHARINEALTSDAQQFIFRHELAHVFYNFSNKRIVINGVIGFLFTVAAFAAAHVVLPILGNGGAIVVGILVAGSVDLLLSYGTNYFFKAAAEKNADLFAVKYSTSQEIKAAADFFDAYERAAQEYRKSIGFPVHPPVFLVGYIDGVMRAKYLHVLAESKTI